MRRLLALAALVTGCAVKPSPTQMAPEVTLHQVRLRNFHNSTLSAVGTSSLIEYHRASADVDFQDLKLDVFRTEPPSPPGVLPPATHLEAPRAVGNLLSRVVEVTDGVTVRLPTGVVARTSAGLLQLGRAAGQRLLPGWRWWGRTASGCAPTASTCTCARTSMTSSGRRRGRADRDCAPLRSGRLGWRRGARGGTDGGFRNPVDVKCDFARMEGPLQQLVCTGHVLVKRRTTDITCDKLVAHYTNRDVNDMTHFECLGNVVAVDGDRWASGDFADYDNQSEVLVMTGQPRGRQGS